MLIIQKHWFCHFCNAESREALSKVHEPYLSPIVFNLNDKYSHWAETDDELGVYYMSTSMRRTEEKKTLSEKN